MRNFVFFYKWITDRRTGNGSLWLRDMQSFPSNEEIKRLSSEGQEFGKEDVVVTGWKEMDEDDFNSFTKRTQHGIKVIEMTDYSMYHPKQRTGKECKKNECTRHKDYLAWNCGNNNLKFCMECKHAHISQYNRSK